MLVSELSPWPGEGPTEVMAGAQCTQTLHLSPAQHANIESRQVALDQPEGTSGAPGRQAMGLLSPSVPMCSSKWALFHQPCYVSCYLLVSPPTGGTSAKGDS